MTDVILNSINPTAKDTSDDGLVLNVASGDLGNADTSFFYFLMSAAGFNAFSMQQKITATTLTYEATNDDLSIEDTADELISTTNDRTFVGAGNWLAAGNGAVVVNAGVLEVTTGASKTGAKLLRANFNAGFGLLQAKQYTLLITVANISSGKVSLYAGTQLIAEDVSAGVGQSFTFTAHKPLPEISVVGQVASATFTIDNVSLKNVGASWTDITTILTGDAAVTSYTVTGAVNRWAALPWARLRVKRVTTNATNSLQLRLTRMKV